MKSNRFTFLIFTLLIMLLGIASRKINELPLFTGDILYAILIYFGFRIIIMDLKKSTSLLFCLLFCFGIEILQLVQLDWLIAIRKTTLGHYVLGQGFLWLDLFCYIIGSLAAFLIDWKYLKLKT